ncbi:fructose bisphosphate aldolase [Nesterenkonia sp.]|uniref:fructose bisphosphate aldolase n=1 Tax=Nesterenkonia sp. TaxID=704201 RepID=UPI002623CA78|nr:fructose bisphosphate aldolase [Nesterenkonia sp.]
MGDQNELHRFETGEGFIAALDQSGGSTPKALRLYGIEDSEYDSEEEMFRLIHQARTRIVTSPAFTGDRILGAILFEATLDGQIDGKGFAEYLRSRGIIPFLKIDKGLEETQQDVQLMRPIPNLDQLLSRAREAGVFGTKERSVIHAAHQEGIAAVVQQQFELAREVLDAGLVPILEPEVSINAPDKQQAEEILKEEILNRLEDLGDEKVAVKITIPEIDNFYSDLIAHPKIARVVALSGGYTRQEANERLSRNHGLIASFSRALLDGLTAQQSDEEFNQTLDETIESIYRASLT